MATNQQINSIVPVEEMEPKYIYYYCLSDAAQTWIVSHSSSTTLPILNKTRFSRLPLPVAPAGEQRRIVDEIEKQFTRLDAAVAGLERIQANLERYKASVLKAACEGRLVPQEADLSPDYEPAEKLLERILEERRRRWEEEEWQKQVERAKKKVEQARRKAAGLPYYFRDMGREDWMDVPEEEYERYLPKSDKWKKKYDSPEPPDTEDLPELPAGWTWVTVEQLASPEPRSIQSGPFGSQLLHSEFQDKGVLAIGIDNVQEMEFAMGEEHRISPEKYDELKRFTARSLDVLITVMATVGRCCVVPAQLETAIITKHVYRITTHRHVAPRFLMYALSGASEVRRQIFGNTRGQTRPGINGTILRGLAIPLPPPVEQKRIVAEVDRRLSFVRSMMTEVQAALDRSERLRQSVLDSAFSGNLVSQDPDDEPASALLARIRGKPEAAVKQPSLPFQGD